MARIVVVTPNPAIDVTYRVDRQLVGGTNRVREVFRRPGGKGLNVARVLEALGHETLCVLPLGGASGDWMQAQLSLLGLAASVTRVAGDTRSTVTVTVTETVTDDATHPTVYTEPGIPPSALEWALLLDDLREQLVGSAMLVVSGSLPRGTDHAVVADLVHAAHAAGVPAIVDSSGDALLAAASAGADVLKPNLDELLEATGANDAQGALALLIERGARLVVASRGSAGLVARDAKHNYSVPAIPGVRGNPTGAGDAATAGLATAILDGLPTERALVHAAAAGAAAVLRPVAGEIDLDAYTRFLRASPATDASPATESSQP